MANLLARGSAWLRSRMLEHASQTVTFVRGATSLEISAVRGRSEFEVIEGESLVRSRGVDWIVAKNALVVAGQPVRPAIGDEFRETVDGVLRQYRVLALGDEVWREEAQGELLRIHTKLVRESATVT
jgi:hypothetical protein